MPESLWFPAISTAGAECNVEPLQSGWLFPGLGCRHVGMGNDLFRRTGTVAQMFFVAEEVLGYRLVPICLEGSGRKVVPPRQESQVIYVLSCAYAVALVESGHRPAAVLGHSLGSWAAAWTAGVYDFTTGLTLLTQVEQLLEDFVDGRELTMGAIIGLDEATVRSEIAAYPQVTLANYNSPAQFVIGGPSRDVESILQSASALGAKRAKRLPTNRPIHTPWMEEVGMKLKPQLDGVTFSDPKTKFMACDTASELQTSAEVRHFFSAFLTRPVRWESSFRNLEKLCESRFLEVGPGALLTSLASFIDPAANVRTATDCLDLTT